MIQPLDLPEPNEAPPAGPDLEYDADFMAMNLAAIGTPESQFGNTVEAATPPDWKEVAAKAMELLSRTRDLRVLVLLAIARLNLGDLAGFAAALATIRVQIETIWEHVHPLLDPEEPEDTMVRSNALLDLKDGARVMRVLRDLPLATPPRMKPVSWRDIAVANGQIEAEPGREKLSEAAIRGAFAATDPANLSALLEVIGTVAAELDKIPKAFDAHAGAGQGPDFELLPKLVRDIRNDLARYEAMTSTSAPPDEEPAQDDAGGDDEPAADRPARAARAGRSFTSVRSIASLESRDDALHALALAATYFRVNEPSSPLPLLIDRATRLAPMPFMDILRDLAPDGLLQAQTVVGKTDEE